MHIQIYIKYISIINSIFVELERTPAMYNNFHEIDDVRSRKTKIPLEEPQLRRIRFFMDISIGNLA